MRLGITTVLAAALAAAAGATETTPEAAAYFNKGVELYNAGKFDEAIAQFEQSIAADPKLVEADEWIATIYLRQGKNVAAVERYQKLLARKPSTAARVSLGLAYLQTGDNAAALKTLREAVALDPQNKVGWNNLSMACLRSGDNAGARDAAEKALALDVGYAPAYVNLGNCYLAQNQPADAITAFDKALALDGAPLDAYYGLGEAYAYAGDNKQAGDNYLLYLKKGGGDQSRRGRAVGWLWDHGRGAEIP